MNIVRYRHYPQSDLSAALDRLANMRAEMDRVFESTFGTFSRSPAPLSRWNAAVDVYQDKDQFTVVVELPGLKKEEIEISLHDDTLTISGERKREESSEQEFLAERSYGKFQRSLTLPSAVDGRSSESQLQKRPFASCATEGRADKAKTDRSRPEMKILGAQAVSS
jgi:HSP20 family protein